MENNKGFLLDTHIFIWWMEGKKELKKEVKTILKDPHSQVYLSVASVWEMVIKINKKKLKLSVNLHKGIRTSRFQSLMITMPHVFELEHLPTYHTDPFDRLLIAQAKAENFTLITADPKIAKYPITVMKND